MVFKSLRLNIVAFWQILPILVGEQRNVSYRHLSKSYSSSLIKGVRVVELFHRHCSIIGMNECG